MNYAIIRQAVIEKCCLTAVYQNRVRHFSPHAIGRSNDGDTNVMAFQYGGDSSKGLPPGGKWRCFRVDDLAAISKNKDVWHTGFDHGRPNTCVTQIDVQAR